MAEDLKPIRFGIIGCASIARKVSRAIRLAPNAELRAVASRSLDKARQFAAENGFPADVTLYGSYEEILEDPTVDALYIPLPTSLHRRWVAEAARKGKHILLEKPPALNVGELDEMLGEVEKKGIQFMDCTMWVHHPRTAQMKEMISDLEGFGELQLIQTSFSFYAGDGFLRNDIRVKPDLDALGALGDAGWYCIRASLWAANYQLPQTVTAIRGTKFNDAGVILACGGSLLWDDGKVATFHCSFYGNITMDLSVIGTKGSLHVNDFVVPFNEESAAFTFASNSTFKELALGINPIPSEHHAMNEVPQEACMVKEFARLVQGIKYGGMKPEPKWADISRKTQLVIDAVKFSIDKDYASISL